MPPAPPDVTAHTPLLTLHESLADLVARSRLLAWVLGELGGAPAALAVEMARCADKVEAASWELLEVGRARGHAFPRHQSRARSASSAS